MKTVIAHKTDMAHVSADACIVWCFDPRFTELLHAFVASQNFKHYDLIKIAGGAKDLAGQTKSPSKDFVIDQIGKSIRLHDPKRIILMAHTNCGAYGMQFPNPNEEHQFLALELDRARRVTKSSFPGLKATVEICVANHEGLHVLE